MCYFLFLNFFIFVVRNHNNLNIILVQKFEGNCTDFYNGKRGDFEAHNLSYILSMEIREKKFLKASIRYQKRFKH